MLHDHYDLDAITRLKLDEVAGFCDRQVDAESLASSIENEDWPCFSRKSLCEYLGIAESTLSGWFKDHRIPRMAKNAYVLLLIQQQLAEQVRELRAKLAAATYD